MIGGAESWTVFVLMMAKMYFALAVQASDTVRPDPDPDR